jgi:hypothetical protein
MNSLPT